MEIHRAGWVLVDPERILANGYVLVEDGVIREAGLTPARPGSGTNVVDHGPGVIMPGLVNAHVHLELTAFRGAIPFTGGFQSWVRDLLIQRDAAGRDHLETMAGYGAAELLSTGTLVAGEISTLGITQDGFSASGLSGVWFQELLGSHLPETGLPLRDPKSRIHLSLAGHAPHSTSPQLLGEIKDATRHKSLPMSIHVAESGAESEFIRTGTGPWADFLEERGIVVSDWPVPSPSPVQYLHKLNLLDPLTLAVHLLDVDARDLDILDRTGTRLVACPRSNLNLHGRLPDIPGFLARGLKPALGTDSLASNDSLSLFDEMAFVASRYAGIRPADILAMATGYGSRALGMEGHAGSLAPGRQASFIYLPIQAASPEALLERIIRYDN
ncbi:MAG: amidohydrolase family protein [Pseudomonadota bacterium]